MNANRVQTSIRLPQDLLTEFRKKLIDRRQNMNAVIHGLVEHWVADPGFETHSTRVDSASGAVEYPVGIGPARWSEQDLLRAYVRWMPAVVLVKEVHGRIICANERFMELVGRRNVVGQLPTDYFDRRTGALILKHDREVQKNQTAMLCMEQLSVKGVLRKRIALRFPIFYKSRPELTGALGFDDEFMSQAVLLDQKTKAGTKARRLPSDHARSIESSEVFNTNDLLASFVDSLPAAVAVKDLDGHMLWVNSEYSAVTGKSATEVLGKLPTDNWPEQVGQLIMAHDQLVRETQCPFMSVDTVPVRGPERNIDRLNLRFPIFDGSGELALTGTIGFDYQVIREAAALMSGAGLSTPDCVPLPSRLARGRRQTAE